MIGVMGKEIERKFLVRRELWKPTSEGVIIRQGYLSQVPERVVRVRLMGDKAYLAIKGKNVGVTRMEFEYEIPTTDAVEMLKLCEQPIIEKTRYQEGAWEVDEFGGVNEGLLLAEIELLTETENFVRPKWLGEEVSCDSRYYNSNLVERPYTTWG